MATQQEPTFSYTPGSSTGLVASMFPSIKQPRLAVTVHCGGCDRELTTTHLGWHIDFAVPCYACDAGADLRHARAHADCGICDAT